MPFLKRQGKFIYLVVRCLITFRLKWCKIFTRVHIQFKLLLLNLLIRGRGMIVIWGVDISTESNPTIIFILLILKHYLINVTLTPRTLWLVDFWTLWVFLGCSHKFILGFLEQQLIPILVFEILLITIITSWRTLVIDLGRHIRKIRYRL